MTGGYGYGTRVRRLFFRLSDRSIFKISQNRLFRYFAISALTILGFRGANSKAS